MDIGAYVLQMVDTQRSHPAKIEQLIDADLVPPKIERELRVYFGGKYTRTTASGKQEESICANDNRKGLPIGCPK